MISQNMLEALNDQIRNELYSGYLYLAMSAYFSDMNLNGFAHWMRMQAKEEDSHAMKFYHYIIDQRARADVRDLEQPPRDFDSAIDIFEKALEHEKFITGKINDLVKLAREENDNATETFLQWYVEEQVEEEASVDEVLQQLKIVGDDGTGLFILDKEMAARVFTPLPGVENRMA